MADPSDLAGEAGAADGPPPADAPADQAPPLGNPFAYVGCNLDDEVRIFQLDRATGQLSARGSAPAGQSPNYLAFHPGGRFVYALNEINPGRVLAFSVNPQSGMLTRLNDASSGGGGPAHLSVHRSGKWVLTANYDTGHAAALPIMDDGRVGPPVAPVQAGAQAHMILDDGVSGKFVFVPSKGDRRTLQYRFDEATGRLTPNDPPFVADPGPPRHMVFHRSGRHAYVLTEGDPGGRRVVAYPYDSTTGLLGTPTRYPAAPINQPGDGAHILIHPTRDFLYASIRFFDSMAQFTIAADGSLSAARQYQTQIARPWDFAIEPTGTFMLVANNQTANVQVLRIDAQTGALSRVGQVAVCAQPRFVGFLPPPP